jgi:hypothetical protein
MTLRINLASFLIKQLLPERRPFVTGALIYPGKDISDKFIGKPVAILTGIITQVNF